MISPGIAYNVAPMKFDRKFVSLAVLLLLAGFGAGYVLHFGAPEYAEPDLAVALDPDCSLNGEACVRALPGDAVVSLSIVPQPVLGASPLEFILQGDGIEIEDAVVDLSGVDMNMGSYRFEFVADERGGYRVEAVLPVCVRNQMQWHAALWLHTRGHGLVQVPYEFTAYKNAP